MIVDSINTSDVIALLEDGPKFQKVLAQWLGVPRQQLRPVLRQMRGDGALRQLPDHRIALGNYRLPSERAREIPPTFKAPIQAPPPLTRQEDQTILHVIDGTEFEVVWNGGPLIGEGWPGGGSSLSAPHDARPRVSTHANSSARS